MRFLHGIAVSLGLALSVSCQRQQTFVPPPVLSSSRGDAAGSAPELQSAYSIEIIVEGPLPKQFTLRWSAQVNTGGWQMTTDRVELKNESGNQLARVFVTLERPAADEMTTQMIETLAREHDLGEQPVDAAELHVRQAVRGETLADPQPHVRVAKTP